MSDLWAYDPDICDGDLCVMCCDRCPKRDLSIEKHEEEEE